LILSKPAIDSIPEATSPHENNSIENKLIGDVLSISPGGHAF